MQVYGFEDTRGKAKVDAIPARSSSAVERRPERSRGEASGLRGLETQHKHILYAAIPARSSSAVEKQAGCEVWKLNTCKYSARPFPRGLRAQSRSKRGRTSGSLTCERTPPRGPFPRGLRAKSRSKRDARSGSSTCTAPKGLNTNSRGCEPADTRTQWILLL